jgi:hypothetical protein
LSLACKSVCVGLREVDEGGFACLRVLCPSCLYLWKGSQIVECRG